MLQVLPQTDAISNFKNKHDNVLAKLVKGPVLLLQRSKPAAVLVAPEQWNEVILRLQEMERREEIRRRLQSQRPDVSYEDFMADLKRMDA